MGRRGMKAATDLRYTDFANELFRIADLVLRGLTVAAVVLGKTPVGVLQALKQAGCDLLKLFTGQHG